MAALDVAFDWLAQRLAPTGLRVALDPRDVNPPCVYLTPPVRRPRYRAGDADVEWTIWVLTVPAGRRAALAALSPMIAAVEDALGGVPVEERPDDWQAPDGGQPYPAYTLTWTERLRGTVP